ncbi:MAG: hypothetical protein ACTSWD_04855 [Candidatus Heimdallarchaeota archaeon]
MMSKIIQKEKERQEDFIRFLESETHEPFGTKNKVNTIVFQSKINCHKQSLINLKEYLEEDLRMEELGSDERTYQLKEDIKALEEIIARYENG